ncbi:hypothetical protein WJX82_006231 [Trebouxia sp. C0006]
MLLSHPLTEHTSVNGWRSSCAQTIFVRHCGKRSTQRLSSSFARASATSPDVIVVGGGAAGLTAAYFAASAGAQVTVLERSKVAGNKVLISGGTRCNVLPMHVDLNKDYFTESSRSALKAVFASWSLEQCKIWLESSDHIGIPLACELADSKYFPVSNSAKEVRDKILQACLKRGVKIRYNAGLERLQSQDDMGWQCSLADGKVLEAKRIVVASGGLSYPHLGTDGSGHRIMSKLGHGMQPMYPALTPLKGPHPGGQQLAGLSLYRVEAAAMVKDKQKGKRKATTAARAGLLFTHRGYSGPAVLDLSHHAIMAAARGLDKPVIKMNWTGQSVESWRVLLDGSQGGAAGVGAVLHRHGLPKRLVDALCHEADVTGTPLAQLKKADRVKLLELLTSYPLPITGHEGYPKAEVTGGGIPLSEINCSTMQSRKLKGLYLCGEICDVFGRIGGFNFYWAWLSGRLAGISAALDA